MDEMGGCMLFYRQFVERDDYELFVVTDRADFSSDRIPHLICEHPKIIRRLMKTRLALFAHDYVHVFGGSWVPAPILEAARQFKPDLIMTGAETWMADLAANLARKLKVPLAGHFMDWPTFAMMGHPWVKRHASDKFRRRYQQCDLAFGICPEMLETLGAHRNAHVFYPSGQANDAKQTKPRRPQGSPFTILFAGNLGQWYGRMLECLAPHFRGENDVRLRIAGGNALWGVEVEKALRQEDTYLGFLKGSEYKAAFDNADALLLIMGFGAENRLIESTSFKSKLADYLTSGLPLVVWGPDYCTAVRHARREDFAEVVTADDPGAVVTAVRALARNPGRSAELVENGLRFWEKNLDANQVMPKALQAINAVVTKTGCQE
jgi:glycosyltransferase involved in cell wall biosynthesis